MSTDPRGASAHRPLLLDGSSVQGPEAPACVPRGWAGAGPAAATARPWSLVYTTGFLGATVCVSEHVSVYTCGSVFACVSVLCVHSGLHVIVSVCRSAYILCVRAHACARECARVCRELQ